MDFSSRTLHPHPVQCPPGLIFVPLGIVLKIQSNAIVEYSLQYDGEGTPESLADCQILDPNEASAHPPCTVTFDITREMKAPIYVYYQLDNFYQVRPGLDGGPMKIRGRVSRQWGESPADG